MVTVGHSIDPSFVKKAGCLGGHKKKPQEGAGGPEKKPKMESARKTDRGEQKRATLQVRGEIGVERGGAKTERRINMKRLLKYLTWVGGGNNVGLKMLGRRTPGAKRKTLRKVFEGGVRE